MDQVWLEAKYFSFDEISSEEIRCEPVHKPKWQRKLRAYPGDRYINP
jgi:hypothetical protein